MAKRKFVKPTQRGGRPVITASDNAKAKAKFAAGVASELQHQAATGDVGAGKRSKIVLNTAHHIRRGQS